MLIFICDDTNSDCIRLEHNLIRYQKEYSASFEITTFHSGKEVLSYIKSKKIIPDLIFLDIYMDSENGVDIAKAMRSSNINSAIIFTTSSKEHAMDSYEVGALYYLQKPYTYENFENAMSRCGDMIKSSAGTFKGSFRRKEYAIPYGDICYIEVSGHSIVIHTAADEEYTFNQSMSDTIQQFEAAKNFLPCGKSFLINLNYLSDYDENNIILTSGIQIPIPVRIKNDISTAIEEWKKR